jgi:hypothetical protein
MERRFHAAGVVTDSRLTGQCQNNYATPNASRAIENGRYGIEKMAKDLQ